MKRSIRKAAGAKSAKKGQVAAVVRVKKHKKFRPDYSAHKRGKLLEAKKHITGRRQPSFI